jgi:DNA-binding winged helix-turn-helix (wHTH) protein/TolB-like protein
MFKAAPQMAIEKRIYYDFFDFRLDAEKEQLLKNGEPVQLTHKAFQILLLLVQNSGQTTTKEDIFKLLWAVNFVEEANLTQHIYILRKTLGQMPDGRAYIETVPKQGYRFTLTPEEISVVEEDLNGERESAHNGEEQMIDSFASESGGGNENNSPAVSARTDTDENVLPKEETYNSENLAAANKKNAPWRTFIVLLLILSFGLLAAATVYHFRERTRRQTAAEIKSIAVLPFKTIGDEVDREKLGLGAADAIITQLSKIQKIEVRPTSEILRYAYHPPPDSVRAGRELRVDAILEGTLQSDGEHIKISVQLTRVSDGYSLWAEIFQAKASDILTMQDFVSRGVAESLSLKLTSEQE